MTCVISYFLTLRIFNFSNHLFYCPRTYTCFELIPFSHHFLNLNVYIFQITSGVWVERDSTSFDTLLIGFSAYLGHFGEINPAIPHLKQKRFLGIEAQSVNRWPELRQFQQITVFWFSICFLLFFCFNFIFSNCLQFITLVSSSYNKSTKRFGHMNFVVFVAVVGSFFV